jgi:hypothetical protein
MFKRSRFLPFISGWHANPRVANVGGHGPPAPSRGFSSSTRYTLGNKISVVREWISVSSKEEESVAGISSSFGDNYWLKRDRDKGFRRNSSPRSRRTAGSASASPRNMAPASASLRWIDVRTIAESGAGRAACRRVHYIEE